MTIAEFLSYLRDLDIKLWVDGNQLRYNAPVGRMTAALRAQIVERKADILTFLRTPPVSIRPAAPPLSSIPRNQELALSFAQERLWFLDQLEPGLPFFNEPFAARLTGTLNSVALMQSFNRIVERHESLRTTFAQQSSVMHGQPVQIIKPSLFVPLPLVDLRALPEPERKAEALRLTREEAQRPFDLVRGPLIRTTLLQLSETEHILLLTLHHIISDGWSLELLVQELIVFYTAILRGHHISLPKLPIQYADFAHWQRQWLQGDVLTAQLAYWKNLLAGAPPALELPTDRPRPPVQSFRGTRQSLTLSRPLTEALKILSRRESATLFMTLLAVFQMLLARYTEQDDIVVGTRIAGRSRPETERLIGFFVNVLMLRTDLSGNPTFRELLGRVRKVTLGAQDHQDLSFEKLVEALQPQRDLSRTPLFQAMFVLQNTPLPPQELPDLLLHHQETDNGTVKYDLDLSLVEVDGQLIGAFRYNTDLFDAATIGRMLGHFQTLAENIVADPDHSLATLPMLTEAERRYLLTEWNETRQNYLHDQRLQTLFEAQAAQTPDTVAMIFDGPPPADRRPPTAVETRRQGDKETSRPEIGDPSQAPKLKTQNSKLKTSQLTYRELNARANQLARHLRSLGVGPEVPVGVCVERSLKTIVALLGILKAGGVYVPLDPTSPPTQLGAILAASRAQVLLTEQRLIGHLQAYAATTICLDVGWEAIARESDADLFNTTTRESLACVMYTSGSTGQSKGVTLGQQQLLNRFAWMWRTYPFAAGEVACQRSAATFSVSMWEFLGALLKGVPTVIIATDVVVDPPRLIQSLADHQITRIVVVPSLLRAILDTNLDLQRRLPHLKLWSTLGEPLSRDLCSRFRERLPHAVLLNQYGASEVLDIAWYDTRLQPGDQPTVPIGRPIDNTQIYVLDRHLQPVPVGVPGQLYVNSVDSIRGYLNQSDLTAERFVPNPFSAQPGARLYNMGDRGYHHADGNLRYLGRRDHQVKIRGIRVEPAGIEAVLEQHSAVRRAVVLALEDAPGGWRLVAYVVPTRGQGIGDREQEGAGLTTASLSPVTCHLSPQELRAFLKEKLPSYMVPSLFVVLESLPATSTGKVDRKALPRPERIDQECEATYVAPQTGLQQAIATVWQELLQVDKVGIHDNFFDLGGHSLMVVQVRNKLREVHHLDVPIIALFEYPTPSALAQHLARQQDVRSPLQQIQEQAETYRTSLRRRGQLRQRQKAAYHQNGDPDA